MIPASGPSGSAPDRRRIVREVARAVRHRHLVGIGGHGFAPPSGSRRRHVITARSADCSTVTSSHSRRTMPRPRPDRASGGAGPTARPGGSPWRIRWLATTTSTMSLRATWTSDGRTRSDVRARVDDRVRDELAGDELDVVDDRRRHAPARQVIDDGMPDAGDGIRPDGTSRSSTSSPSTATGPSSVAPLASLPPARMHQGPLPVREPSNETVPDGTSAERGAGAGDQLATSRWPARPLISSSRCTDALGERSTRREPAAARGLVGLDDGAQAGRVDERHAGDVDDLDRRIGRQPLGEVGRRVAVDLTLEDERPVGVDRELETWILGRHGRPLYRRPSGRLAARGWRVPTSSRHDREPVSRHPYG